MRVLILADVRGGVATFVRELAAGLTAGGDEVHLALLGPPERVPDDVAVASVRVRDLRLEWMAEPWADVARAADWIEQLTAEVRPDVVHLNTFAGGWPDHRTGPAPGQVLTVHSDVCTWWRAVHGLPAPPEWHRYRELAAAALSRAEIVVTPTAALRDALAAEYGELPSGTRVVHNGSTVPEAPAGPRERLVVCAGRLWDEAKGAARLEAAEPAIDGRVELIEDLPHTAVLDRFRRAAVFAEPARYEPFGLAALEAARSGCALVLGDIPSLREVWGEAAAYVALDDPAALAGTVNAVLADPAPWVRAAQERARAYDSSAMLAGYREAYAAADRTGVAACR